MPTGSDAEARAHLAPVAKLLRPGALADRLTAIKKHRKRVRFDPDSAAYWFETKLGSRSHISRTGSVHSAEGDQKPAPK